MWPLLAAGRGEGEAEGVQPQTIRAILERNYAKCSLAALLGVELASGTIARDGSDQEARGEILQRWGRAGLVSLAYAIVSAQAYPAFKYAVGHGHACVRLRIGNEIVLMQSPQYA